MVMSIILGFAAALSVLVLFLSFARAGASTAPTRSIEGDGEYETAIVGESYHQAALIEICGPYTEDGADLEIRATLVPEFDNPHDPNAVRVEILGHVVGHLSRSDASSFRNELRAAGDEHTRYVVEAQIRGGWRRQRRGRIDEGLYGVRLDLKRNSVGEDFF